MITAISHRLRTRSVAMLMSLEARLDRILVGWLLAAALIAGVRIALVPVRQGPVQFEAVLPYILIILAPFVTTLLALRWFRDGDQMQQPVTRLSLVGRWRSVSRSEARLNSAYGTSGIMVSLLIGMMLNVPVRALEYFAIMPPIPSYAPHWLLTLRSAMTLDVVIFTSLYMVAFVAALRRVPLFPRLLVAIWAADIAMQLGIAQMVGREALPLNAAEPLSILLAGNVKKVLISVAIWMPYLLMSKRVNVTYRLRIPA